MLKNIKSIAFLTLLWTTGFSVIGQNKFSFTYKEGLSFYEKGNIKKAIYVLEKVVRNEPYHAQAYYLLGSIYYETFPKELAITYYEKAYELDKLISKDILYRIGYVYQLIGNIQMAQKYYDSYLKWLNQLETTKDFKFISDESMKTYKRIQECSIAKTLYKHSFGHQILNIGDSINTAYEEYSPVITADNQLMYFTSRRPHRPTEELIEKQDIHEDIWFTTRHKDGHWATPKKLEGLVNTHRHESCVGVSPDGSMLFLYQSENGGDLYTSTKTKSGEWSSPAPIKEINTAFKEPSVTISADKTILYFSSNRPGGFGGLDLYKVTKQKNGTWSAPINLGATVNTEGDEDSPFISADDKHFYFSSNGHFGMGGYDIFKSEINPKTRMPGEPKNVGAPINSSDDDIYFVIAADKKSAYYSSAKIDGYGEKDIYKIDLDTSFVIDNASDLESLTKLPVHLISYRTERTYTSNAKVPATPGDLCPDKSEAIALSKGEEKSNSKCIILQGSMPSTKNNTAQASTAKLSIQKDDAFNKIHTVLPDAKGRFEVALERGHRYSLDIVQEGYLLFSEAFFLPNDSNMSSINMGEVALEKPTVGKRIILKNIFFRTGSAYVNPESRVELNYLVDVMKAFPKMKVEISGHTDRTGRPEINKLMSEARAKAVKEYLTDKGIESDRMTAVGYGSEVPIAPNDNEVNRRKNRRTEFLIIEL